jgi:nicotinamidase-related amidase
VTDALLLMDIQNGVVGRFGAGDDYLDRVVAAQATAEAVGIPVILVRVGFCPSGVVLSTVREAPTSTTGSRYWPTCAWTPMRRYTGC